MTRSIEFFWDAASPFTYLASTQIEAIAADCHVAIDWRPFYLGAVFKASGNQAPANVPAKGRYLFRDLQYWARFYAVPLTFPSNFPANTLQAGRTAIVATNLGHGARFARNLMHAHWAKGKDISDPEVLANVLAASGMDPDQVAGEARQPSIKEQFMANTNEAVARGAFGAPTMFVEDAMFFGNDRLELLRAHIKGEL